MEELESEDDFDTRGVGSASNALSRRLVGDGNTRSRRAYAHNDEEEEDDDDDDDDDETSDESEEDSEEEDGVRLPLMDPEEEALADAAMARIRRAQAKGKRDVKLSKEELVAYQRKLQRIEAEKQRKRRDQRVAVPLEHLDLGPRRKRLSLENGGSSHPPSDAEERRASNPPMGYFPPPSSRHRTYPGSTPSRPRSRAAIDREPSSSPFNYTYARGEHPATLRQPSDPVPGRPLSQSLVDARNGGSPASAAGPSQDPFQYMTGGKRTTYHAAAGSVRNSITQIEDRHSSYGSSPAVSRRPSGGARDEESSESSESSEEEESRPVARVTSGSGSRPRPRDSTDSRREPVPEPVPEPVLEPRPARGRTPPLAKKPSRTRTVSPGKRKSVVASTKSVRRKGK